MEINEGFIKRLFKDLLDEELSSPFARLTYNEALERFGTDKPDTRYGLEIVDISDTVRDCGFGVFTDVLKLGGTVRAINVKDAFASLSRKEIDRYVEFVRGIGGKGLAFIRLSGDGQLSSSFGKFMSGDEMGAILERTGAENGDVILIAADKKSMTLSILGALRTSIAKQLQIIPNGYNFLWITDFPYFEYDAESGVWNAMHHPFTRPADDSIECLETDPGKVYAEAYDLVLNGVELSSGSIRITDAELQERMFKALGLTDEEIEAKFGFLVEAYKYGSPPHGGAGIGIDRLAMVICGADSLRDVTAFPKVQNASELMSSCPSFVDAGSLDLLGIKIKED
jgi:aspartyl-tRNA synthetase